MAISNFKERLMEENNLPKGVTIDRFRRTISFVQEVSYKDNVTIDINVTEVYDLVTDNLVVIMVTGKMQDEEDIESFIKLLAENYEKDYPETSSEASIGNGGEFELIVSLSSL